MNPLMKKLFMALGVVPRPGESTHTEESLEKGYLNLFAQGEGVDGAKVNCRLQFFKDVGYKETARMIIESGLCFIFNNDKVKQTGGMWTTASCFGDTLLDRLCDPKHKDTCSFKFYAP